MYMYTYAYTHAQVHALMHTYTVLCIYLLSCLLFTIFLPHHRPKCKLGEGRKFISEAPAPSKVKVKVAQSCLTLCDPMVNTIHGIPQARILEWVAFPSYRGSSQPRDRTQVSCIAGGFFTS